MKKKAASSLVACKALVSSRLTDSAASRLYYALFQAGVHVLERQGKNPADFTSGATQWAHGWICDNAYLFRKVREDKRLFKMAYSLRERADYRVPPVQPCELDPLLPRAEDFVQDVCA